ncbi:MAG: hypothetical protein CMK53_05070 [Proteobacteria bacterium]|nr:hypothetical protein [Deltaproteobacteria bacterium]MAD99989.1 hypothetical protein [Pseudomonadota bacterium]HCP34219.1 hypothetical protein [Deltaproteobacteria bacterium]
MMIYKLFEIQNKGHLTEWEDVWIPTALGFVTEELVTTKHLALHTISIDFPRQYSVCCWKWVGKPMKN